MAKGQKRSNREIKKPKAAKKPGAAETATQRPSSVKIVTPPRTAGK